MGNADSSQTCCFPSRNDKLNCFSSNTEEIHLSNHDESINNEKDIDFFSKHSKTPIKNPKINIIAPLKSGKKLNEIQSEMASNKDLFKITNNISDKFSGVKNLNTNNNSDNSALGIKEINNIKLKNINKLQSLHININNYYNEHNCKNKHKVSYDSYQSDDKASKNKIINNRKFTRSPQKSELGNNDNFVKMLTVPSCRKLSSSKKDIENNNNETNNENDYFLINAPVSTKGNNLNHQLFPSNTVVVNIQNEEYIERYLKRFENRVISKKFTLDEDENLEPVSIMITIIILIVINLIT